MNVQSIFKKIALVAMLFGAKSVIAADPIPTKAVETLDRLLNEYSGYKLSKKEDKKIFCELLQTKIQYETLQLKIAKHNGTAYSLQKNKEQQGAGGEIFFDGPDLDSE